MSRLEAAKKTEQRRRSIAAFVAKGTHIYPKVGKMIGSHCDVHSSFRNCTFVTAGRKGYDEGASRECRCAQHRIRARRELESAKSVSDMYTDIATAVKKN